MMNAISIRQHVLPLSRIDRDAFSRVLAEAFSHDQAMTSLMGRKKWQAISRRFFKTQLHHSDIFLTAHRGEKLVGLLVARSPSCQIGLHQLLISPLLIRLLLGRHHKITHAIGQEISMLLPDHHAWYINHLGVLPDEQHTGVGASLLKALRQLEPNETVWVDCEAALESFYHAHSYQVYGHCNDGALILMKSEA